jgi:hypothetical protein
MISLAIRRSRPQHRDEQVQRRFDPAQADSAGLVGGFRSAKAGWSWRGARQR